MFVEIEIRTRAVDDRIVVPRASLHDGSLYVVDAENRLDIRPVRIGLIQGDFATVEDGITAGGRIVVSDLIPAVAGMLLAPKEDDALSARLKAEAGGGAPQP
jgi:multidrug efflux pump subunit AcrA (membrane-fusion protein)